MHRPAVAQHCAAIVNGDRKWLMCALPPQNTFVRPSHGQRITDSAGAGEQLSAADRVRRRVEQRFRELLPVEVAALEQQAADGEGELRSGQQLRVPAADDLELVDWHTCDPSGLKGETLR